MSCVRGKSQVPGPEHTRWEHKLMCRSDVRARASTLQVYTKTPRATGELQVFRTWPQSHIPYLLLHSLRSCCDITHKGGYRELSYLSLRGTGASSKHTQNSQFKTISCSSSTWFLATRTVHSSLTQRGGWASSHHWGKATFLPLVTWWFMSA